MKKLVVSTLLMLAMQTSTIFGGVTAGVIEDINYTKYDKVAGATKEISKYYHEAIGEYTGADDIQSIDVDYWFKTERKRKAYEKRDKKFQKAMSKVTKKWTNTTANVREEPSVESDILITLPENTMVTGFEFEGWFYLTKTNGHIKASLLNDEPAPYKDIQAPWNSGWKSWMPYTAITARGTRQYTLQYNYAYTGNYGIRQINDRYCVALGSYFGVSIGQYFDLILENGDIIPCIMADAKANIHTDYLNATTMANGCMSEFIVDRGALDRNALSSGTIGSVTESWKSPISIVRVYDINVLE